MNMSSDIKPITYLKANAAELLEQINETHRPVIITQNGEPRAVLQDPQSYENMRNALGMLKLISQGEEDIKKGKTRSQENVFDKLEKFLRAKCRGNMTFSGQNQPKNDFFGIIEYIPRNNPSQAQKNLQQNKTGHLQSFSFTKSGPYYPGTTRARSGAVSRTDHFALESHV